MTTSTLDAISPLDRLEALKNWEKGPRSRMEPSIAPMRDLMARLGNPYLRFSAIHVTGTKGKGSVCALLEASLHQAGLRVGRYASPHVHSICERISLRRKDVAEDRLMEALERVLDVRDQASLAGTPASAATWFDVFTAAAFTLFALDKLDWVVVEVGLGGRLDSTNVLDGKVCVVTNIGLEHTDVLGPTMADIAHEKAGIIKRGACVVTSVDPESEAHAVIRARAAQLDVAWVDVPRADGITQGNLAIARAVLDNLGRMGVVAPRAGLPLSGALLDAHVARSAALPGRMQQMAINSGSRTIPLLVDGAHVDIALAAVLREAQAQDWAAGPLFALVALGRDKHARRILAQFRGCAGHVLFTGIEGRDCREPEELVAIAAELGVSSSVAADAQAGLRACLRLASEGGWVLATGSLHLARPVQEAALALGARSMR